MKLFLLVLLAALACLAPLHAQSPDASPEPSRPPLPSGPLVGKADDLSKWTITYSLPKSAPDPASGDNEPKKPKPVPKVITVSKSGPLRRITFADAAGRQNEIWCQGAMQVAIRPEWKQPILVEGTETEEALSFRKWLVDFPDFGWVSAKNYTGVQKVRGRDCLIFQDDVSIGNVVVAAPAKPGTPAGYDTGTVIEGKTRATACVDLETRLPVALNFSNETCTYQFSTLDAPLVLPADTQAVFDARAKRLQELTRHPSKPY